MTARNAGKDERALKRGHERTQMLITYRQTNVDERADDWKSMLPVLISARASGSAARRFEEKCSCKGVVCFSFVRGNLALVGTLKPILSEQRALDKGTIIAMRAPPKPFCRGYDPS